MLGYAWQKGLVPLDVEPLRDAIRANGAAVSLNLRAFEWGRMCAIDLAEVEGIAGLVAPIAAEERLEDLIERRVKDLTSYQNAAYANRYRQLLDRVIAGAKTTSDGDEPSSCASVALSAYKLMAYKDEYEVTARLYAALRNSRLYSKRSFRRRTGCPSISRPRFCRASTSLPAVQKSASSGLGCSRPSIGWRKARSFAGLGLTRSDTPWSAAWSGK